MIKNKRYKSATAFRPTCIVWLLAVFCIVGSAGCRQSDVITPKGPESTWKLGSHVFVPTVVKRNFGAYLVAGEEDTRSSLFIQFFHYPVADGSYLITNGIPITPQTISIEASVIPEDNISFVFKTTGSERFYAEVKVRDGKIGISIPPVWAKRIDVDDSLQISGHLVEM